MSTYLRPFRWLKLRHTKQGWRVGVGPRWFREWYGTGGRGVSTGWGPFTKYWPIRSRPVPLAGCRCGRLAKNHQTDWCCVNCERSPFGPPLRHTTACDERQGREMTVRG